MFTGVIFGACIHTLYSGEKSISPFSPDLRLSKASSSPHWWWCADCGLSPPISIGTRLRMQSRWNILLPDVYSSQSQFAHRQICWGNTASAHNIAERQHALAPLSGRQALRQAFIIIRTDCGVGLSKTAYRTKHVKLPVCALPVSSCVRALAPKWNL